MKNPFAKAIRKHSGKDPSEEEQKELGKPRANTMTDDHQNFLKIILRLIDEGKIDTKTPSTFLNNDVYAALSHEMRAKTDRVIPNIASLLERIMDLHSRPEEDNSFEMVNLIETLWQAKQRIEDHADVFIF